MNKINYVILSLSILFLGSCNCKQSTETHSSAGAENEKIIREYFTLFNNHEWEKMAGLYAEPAEFKDPALGNEVISQSRKDIVEHYSGLQSVFADIKDDIVQIYPSGEKHVIVEFISKGTAPDGSQFELPICTIFTVENGKITKDYTYYDNFEESNEE